jgi:hypothetical protein
MFPETGYIARFGFLFSALGLPTVSILFEKLLVNAYNDRAALLEAPGPHLTRPERIN